MMVEERSNYADGRIQAQISMKAHRFFRDHSYPNEPLYRAVDRIIAMYKVSDVAPLIEENRKLKIALEANVKTMEEYKQRYQHAQETIKEMNGLLEKRTLGDFIG